ncbi:MAG: hypothetical protein SVY41_01600 [Candidatus Nanohaloarchaea archaeon]|nr:hypothetical protein [Candidatus Nanohaloarchaea archaeon]
MNAEGSAFEPLDRNFGHALDAVTMDRAIGDPLYVVDAGRDAVFDLPVMIFGEDGREEVYSYLIANSHIPRSDQASIRIEPDRGYTGAEESVYNDTVFQPVADGDREQYRAGHALRPEEQVSRNPLGDHPDRFYHPDDEMLDRFYDQLQG